MSMRVSEPTVQAVIVSTSVSHNIAPDANEDVLRVSDDHENTID